MLHNQHPTAEPLPVDDFVDDYMFVLNDEEMMPNYSLDDMKFQHEEDNLIVKERPDQSNKPKYVNVVIDDYKPPLETVFACVKSKKKKCGIRTNYVLRSVKERKKRLAMALDLPFGQQGTTTPVPQTIRSMSFIGDTIVAPEFEEEISGQPKIWSINELMTMQEFVENLSRQDGCERDKGFWGIVVGPIFWLTLAILTRLKKAGCKTVEPNADWVMVSSHFLPCILGGSMPNYFSNGVKYPVPWRDVKKETMVENNEENIATAAYLVSKRAWGSLQEKGVFRRVENHAKYSKSPAKCYLA
ncbi:hypothetical protein Tco_0952113 [Tanacetum coccineum]|uniref:Uncharacterized protein n=1 Tax=Tanacetum coccineum TaxID=301880 RepID=A0ABQ5DXW9_9ASTR